LDALYAKREQITMLMMHGFDDIGNKLTDRSTHVIQHFRAVLLAAAQYCAKAEDLPLSSGAALAVAA
jgi:hypothetical protein